MDFMKKGIILSGLLIVLAAAAWAQPSITLLTFGGYTFPDQFDMEYGEGKIEDGFQWGGGLEFGLAENAALELFYQGMTADAYYEPNLNTRKTGTTTANYIMIGGTKYAPFNEKISGFGSLDIGAGWFNPDTDLAVEGATKFAWGGRLGVRVQASEKVSLRIHAQLLSPVQWAGGGFYFGTGGSGAGVSTGSTIYQFNLGGSLNFRLK